MHYFVLLTKFFLVWSSLRNSIILSSRKFSSFLLLIYNFQFNFIFFHMKSHLFQHSLLHGSSCSSISITYNVCMYVSVAQLCLILCSLMDCSSMIPWTRILEWVAIPFSRGFSQPRIEPGLLQLQVDFLWSEPPCIILFLYFLLSSFGLFFFSYANITWSDLVTKY